MSEEAERQNAQGVLEVPDTDVYSAAGEGLSAPSRGDMEAFVGHFPRTKLPENPWITTYAAPLGLGSLPEDERNALDGIKDLDGFRERLDRRIQLLEMDFNSRWRLRVVGDALALVHTEEVAWRCKECGNISIYPKPELGHCPQCGSRRWIHYRDGTGGRVPTSMSVDPFVGESGVAALMDEDIWPTERLYARYRLLKLLAAAATNLKEFVRHTVENFEAAEVERTVVEKRLELVPRRKKETA